MEGDFLAEVLGPEGRPVAAGTPGELIVTPLGRTGCPLLRYRTGDRVVVDPRPCPCGRTFLRLEGGIRGRWDDMVQVRGNNLHPEAVEAVVLAFPEVAEYRLIIDRTAALAEVRLELEPRPGLSDGDAAGLADRVERAVRDRLLFRVEPALVPPGSLPRSEMKSRRVVFHG
jgi:phenylacetate-CoA ligase